MNLFYTSNVKQYLVLFLLLFYLFFHFSLISFHLLVFYLFFLELEVVRFLVFFFGFLPRFLGGGFSVLGFAFLGIDMKQIAITFLNTFYIFKKYFINFLIKIDYYLNKIFCIIQIWLHSSILLDISK